MKKTFLGIMTAIMIFSVAFTQNVLAASETAESASEFPVGKMLITSLIIGFIISLIVNLIMRSKLKSVAPREEATEYVVPGSLNITESREFFLYRHVTRTKKQNSQPPQR